MAVAVVCLVTGACADADTELPEPTGERVLLHSDGWVQSGAIWMSALELDWRRQEAGVEAEMQTTGTLTTATRTQLQGLQASLAADPPPQRPPGSVYDAPSLLLYFGPNDDDFVDLWRHVDYGSTDDARLVDANSLCKALIAELEACEASEHFTVVNCR